MKFADLDASLVRRAAVMKLTPDGDVVELRLRSPELRARPDKPEAKTVQHDMDNPLCACDDCKMMFQAADG